MIKYLFQLCLLAFVLFITPSTAQTSPILGNGYLIAYDQLQGFEQTGKYGIIFPDGEAYYFSTISKPALIRSFLIYPKEMGSILAKIQSAGFKKLPNKIEPTGKVFDGPSEDLLLSSTTSCKLVNAYAPEEKNATTLSKSRAVLLNVFSKVELQGKIVTLQRLSQKVNNYLKKSGDKNCGKEQLAIILRDITEQKEPEDGDSVICLQNGKSVVLEEAGDNSPCHPQNIWQKQDASWLCDLNENKVISNAPLDKIGITPVAKKCELLEKQVCPVGEFFLFKQKLCSTQHTTSLSKPCSEGIENIQIPVITSKPTSCHSEACYLKQHRNLYQQEGSELSNQVLLDEFLTSSTLTIPTNLDSSLKDPGVYCVSYDKNSLSSDGTKTISSVELVKAVEAPKTANSSAISKKFPSSLSCENDDDCLYRKGTCLVPALAEGLSNVEASEGRCECLQGTISGCEIKNSQLK